MKQKLLAVLLAVTMVLSLFPLNVFAVEAGDASSEEMIVEVIEEVSNELSNEVADELFSETADEIASELATETLNQVEEDIIVEYYYGQYLSESTTPATAKSIVNTRMAAAAIPEDIIIAAVHECDLGFHCSTGDNTSGGASQKIDNYIKQDIMYFGQVRQNVWLLMEPAPGTEYDVTAIP